MNQPQLHKQEEQVSPKKASVIQIAKTVFSSFLGVSKRQDNVSDAPKITLAQIVVAGIFGVAIFISLILLVVFAVTK
jgi:hypothetical protein